MRPQGTVYQFGKASASGEVRIALTEKEREHWRVMRFVGTNLSGFALAFAIFVYGPTFELDLNYQAGLAKAEVSSNEERVMSQREKLSNEFVVSIPAIGATANVVPNIDPYNEVAYLEALKKGVAHASGTGLPGEGRRIFLFAHSTNSPINFSEYNAVFYQLRLLSEGDRIFVNHNGESYLYIVKQKVIVEADDTSWLTEIGNEEELVLQTCDPPGTTLRRLLVIANRGTSDVPGLTNPRGVLK
jgi:LPXTG-site transpeptidase (sortase) family protein